MKTSRIGAVILASQLLACSATGPGTFAGRSGFIMSCQQYVVDRAGLSYTASRATVDLHNADSMNTVEGGTVTVRGQELEHLYSAATGPYYTSEESGGAFPYARPDGSWHVVRIAGSAAFPPITDSIQALPEAVSFNGLQVGDTIHRTRSNVIRWKRTDGRADSVHLGIYNDAGTYMYIAVPDSGEVLLAPLDLNRTVAGRAYLTISRIKRRVTSGPLNMVNEMSFESVHDVEVMIAR
ncbi:MAG: hypothetical protein JST22_10490 [Bacteroidetes bacterium]|nr:hypothetical protein [Bacteroidota bacterium]